ncbi:MFS transporter [Aspergillus steynii IBT 23096]|uniref:MFS transporter n=1 Tax=Aspergillus steynii IBT 23096 TaxID=1392250 RepID=A0A2I2GEJ7_9EURO|nr:MFS transporter [Aspergillus steynii IBT 23096]PLB51326.1 MFS transporter [Aspergillus steynii IBT 23096]
MTANEESPLLQNPTEQSSSVQEQQKGQTERANQLVVYGSFIGIFVAAADDSLAISTWSSIASQFQRLSEGSWLVVAYNFGFCVSLPMYGTLSSMYGRKNVLLGAYALFAVGCIACGVSGSLEQLVFSRVLAGISGGGMISLVSIIITDLIPPDDVALFRSYANVVSVLGRSLGAPLGGLLIQTIGWRWSFLGQLPLVIACGLVAAYGLPSSLNIREVEEDHENAPPTKLSEVDFTGLFFLALSTVILLFLLQDASVTTEDHSHLMTLLVPSLVAAVGVFLFVEAYCACRPLIPLNLVAGSLGGYSAGQVLMNTARMAVVSNLVPYFVRVDQASNVFASSTYVISASGVSIGGVVAGAIIKRTKRSKKMSIIAVGASILVYILIFARWRDGCSIPEMFYLFPNGFAAGILFSTQFIGMSFGAPKGCLETCITTYYLFQQLGLIIGPASGVAVVQRVFGNRLSQNLDGFEEKQFIGRILDDARFAENLSDSVQQVVRSSYLYAFQFVPLISAACSVAMLPIVLWLKEEKIE